MKEIPQSVTESVRRFVLSAPPPVVDKLQSVREGWIIRRISEGILRNRKCREVCEFLLHTTSFIVPDSETDCWQWCGGLDTHGYPRIRWAGSMIYLHRLFLEIKGVLIVPKVDYCCHHCDNPKCLNPDHLYKGTAKTNIDDCIRRGRYNKTILRGDSAPGRKLSEIQVVEIRSLLGSTPQTVLADRFGVTKTTICDIQHGRTWREP